MSHHIGDTQTEGLKGAKDEIRTDEEVRAAIQAAIESEPLTPEELRRRMSEDLERCREMQERLLEVMGEPLPAGWSARMIREGRP